MDPQPGGALAETGEDADTPRLPLRRAALVPLLPKHHDFVYEVIASDEVAWRWRYRGDVPSYDVVIGHLWDGVSVMKLIIDRHAGSMAGLASLYNHSHRSRTAFVAAVGHPSQQGTGVLAEGTAALIDYGFAVLGLRKVYIEALEFNVSQFPVVERLSREEGRMVGHELHAGRYWDMVTLAIYRDDWYELLRNPLSIATIRSRDGRGATARVDVEL